jgi:hypothetical protein
VVAIDCAAHNLVTSQVKESITQRRQLHDKCKVGRADGDDGLGKSSLAHSHALCYADPN